MERCRVLILDDHPVFRNGLRRVVESAPELVCVGEVGDAPSARRFLTSTQVDVLTVDLALPNGSGLDLLHAVRVERPSTITLVMSMCDETVYGMRALRAGARGFLSKGASAEEVRMAILAVWRGELAVSGALRERIVQQGVAWGAGEGACDGLTDRELDVLHHLASGAGTAQIASSLGVSVKTVETHRANIARKLGVRGTAALVRAAVALRRDGSTSRPA